jgi:penicillin-binding protein 1B
LTVRIQARGLARWAAWPAGRAALALGLALFVLGGIAFIHYYNVYAAVIDRRLSHPVFDQPSLVFAAPETVSLGETLTPGQLVTWLRDAGYSQRQESPVGRFVRSGDMIRIQPGPEAYRATAPAVVEFVSDSVGGITDPQTQAAMDHYSLEPALLTSLFNEKREKRRLVHYADLPPQLIQAVLAIEDENYFQHGAVNWWRVLAAAFRDVRSGRPEQGASTIDMQVARNIFGLGFQRTFRRKMEETLVAFELESRLTKQQIFELYANQLYMGQHGSYSIHGFGEAADAYYGKTVEQLTLPEDALLAGIIHGPNLDSPYRHPRRARARRDQVLAAMVRVGDITEAQREAADKAPLVTKPANTEVSDAPYFVDMVRDRISDKIPESKLTTQRYRIYTTLDPELQAYAAQAVQDGMKQVDHDLAALRARRRRRPGAKPPEKAQVALVALDPHTGAVVALIGGRNYAFSQLNHVLAERPTGSTFKPFVYATALETGLLPNLTPITQTTTLMDEPTSFPCRTCRGGEYRPANFEHKYFGKVTLRTALARSLNNATISLALQVGLQPITDLAHSAGIIHAEPTPSEAIGTYTATPLAMAGAYTIFDNGGLLEPPRLVYAVQSDSGKTVYAPQPRPQQILDPRVAFLVTNLMESVLDEGTGVRARADGFDAPAAGKTGTENDSWFAGYTNKLLCVVWVGLDNYHDLKIEGAHAALPIWAEFMKDALKLPAYANPQPFLPPPGVVGEQINVVNQMPVTPGCPATQVETDYYLDGTQPTGSCGHPFPLVPRGLVARAAQLLHLSPKAPPPPPPVALAAVPQKAATIAVPIRAAPAPPAAKPKPKKRGFFGKILHALGGGGKGRGGG